MVEEFLGDPRDGTPDEFRFYVFGGQVALVQVERGRLSNHRRGFFLPDWSPLDLKIRFPRLRMDEPPPAQLGEMLEVAGRLGECIDFVRVDLYSVDGLVKFGEMTHSPRAGTVAFPSEFAYWLGTRWPSSQYWARRSR